MLFGRMIEPMKAQFERAYEACREAHRGDERTDPTTACRSALIALYYGIILLAALTDGLIGALCWLLFDNPWNWWLAIAVACISSLVSFWFTRPVLTHIESLGHPKPPTGWENR